MGETLCKFAAIALALLFEEQDIMQSHSTISTDSMTGQVSAIYQLVHVTPRHLQLGSYLVGCQLSITSQKRHVKTPFDVRDEALQQIL